MCAVGVEEAVRIDGPLFEEEIDAGWMGRWMCVWMYPWIRAYPCVYRVCICERSITLILTSPRHGCPVRIVGIEDLKTKRDAVSERVLEKQEEKLKIQNDLHVLTERLARVTDDLTKMSAERDDYDRE